MKNIFITGQAENRQFIALFILTIIFVVVGKNSFAHRFVDTSLNYAIAPILALKGGVLGSFESMSSSVQTGLQLRQENVVLKQQKFELQAKLQLMEQQSLDYQNLLKEFKLETNLVEMRELERARIVGNVNQGLSQIAYLDKGSKHGMLTGDLVINSEGLLGVVVDAAEGTSKVLLITDYRSSVPALHQGSNLKFIINGIGETDRLVTYYYNLEGRVINQGDKMFTSGLGGKYPKGVFIGTAAKIEREDKRNRWKITLKPAADMDSLYLVAIIPRQQTSETFQDD